MTRTLAPQLTPTMILEMNLRTFPMTCPRMMTLRTLSFPPLGPNHDQSLLHPYKTNLFLTTNEPRHQYHQRSSFHQDSDQSAFRLHPHQSCPHAVLMIFPGKTISSFHQECPRRRNPIKLPLLTLPRSAPPKIIFYQMQSRQGPPPTCRSSGSQKDSVQNSTRCPNQGYSAKRISGMTTLYMNRRSEHSLPRLLPASTSVWTLPRSSPCPGSASPSPTGPSDPYTTAVTSTNL